MSGGTLRALVPLLALAMDADGPRTRPPKRTSSKRERDERRKRKRRARTVKRSRRQNRRGR